MSAVYDTKKMQIRFEYTNDEDEEIKVVLPGRFEVCDACSGRGTTTRHIEPDGGGFTGEEWAEACHDDPDFSENYFGGMYDRPCDTCQGLRVVLVPDEEHCKPEDLRRFHEEARADAEYRREVAYCRRYGI